MYFHLEGESTSIGRLIDDGEFYRDAQIYRNGKWTETYPAELLFKANPCTKERAIEHVGAGALRIEFGREGVKDE